MTTEPPVNLRCASFTPRLHVEWRLLRGGRIASQNADANFAQIEGSAA
jgi:hypothetical protein